MMRCSTGNWYILGYDILKDRHAISSSCREYRVLLNGDFGIPGRSQFSAEMVNSGFFKGARMGGVMGGVGGTIEGIGEMADVFGETRTFAGEGFEIAWFAANPRARRLLSLRCFLVRVTDVGIARSCESSSPGNSGRVHGLGSPVNSRITGSAVSEAVVFCLFEPS